MEASCVGGEKEECRPYQQAVAHNASVHHVQTALQTIIHCEQVTLGNSHEECAAEGACDCSVQGSHPQERDEVSDISFADASAHPWAVMVLFLYANAACAAME